MNKGMVMTTIHPTYTHGYHQSVLRSHSNRTVENSGQYLSSALTPNPSVLDVGSGAGTITADIAQRVSPGQVTALALTEESLALTRNEITRQTLSNVSFVLGDVHDLEFADGSFDIVHAHQVLQHVKDPVQALKEMKRVCKPGGIVAARDSDYAGFIWYPELPELDQWMQWYQQAARASDGESNAGRQLQAWAQRAGFTVSTATTSTWCLSTPAARQWWGGMWSDRILASKIARRLCAQGIATRSDLERISEAWLKWAQAKDRSEEHTSELQSRGHLVCRLLLEKKHK